MTKTMLTLTAHPENQYSRDQAHSHHWRIDEPAGSTSIGRCRRCGAQRAFQNWVSETDFITATDYSAGGAPGASMAG